MKKDMMWGILLHLSTHEWQEPGSPPYGMYLNKPWKDTNNVDLETWDAVIAGLPQYGINTVLIDVGDAVQYDSHPEISAPDAWSDQEKMTLLLKEKSRVEAEVGRYRALRDAYEELEEWLGFFF